MIRGYDFLIQNVEQIHLDFHTQLSQLSQTLQKKGNRVENTYRERPVRLGAKKSLNPLTPEAPETARA